MPFTAPEQVVVMAMLLLGGLLIGFALAPSPTKWKRRVAEQSERFTEYHRDAEDRLRAANQRAADLNAEADALRADYADTERTIADLRARVTTPAVLPVAPVAVPVADPVIERAHNERIVEAVPDPQLAAEALAEPPSVQETAIDPEPEVLPMPVVEIAPMTPTPSDAPPAPLGAATPDMPSKGWFAGSARDDLTRLHGIDTVLDTRLFGLGVTRFEDIEQLSAEDEMALEQRLSLPAGFIARQQWRTQAALLRAAQDDEHATRFAPLEQMRSA